MCPPHQRPEVDTVLISRSYRWMLWRREEILCQTRTGLPSKRRYESWLSTGRYWYRQRTEQGNEKSLQPNTHNYNQNHTITVFVKYTRNALQITRLSQTNKSNALTCMESTNQHSPGDGINSTYVSIPTAWPRS